MSLSVKNIPLNFQGHKTISKWFPSTIYKTMPVFKGFISKFSFKYMHNMLFKHL